MLGVTQLAWLKSALLSAQQSGTIWKFVAVSDPIDQLGPIGGALTGSLTTVNSDGGKSWIGGYRAERNDLLKYIADNHITNVVFLATDDHQNRINELTYSPTGALDTQSSYTKVPYCFSIVCGPLGATGPETITDHSYSNIKAIADDLATRQASAGLEPIGLMGYPGLKNLVRDGDATASSSPQAVDFYSPDTFNYTVFDVSADGKTLSVTSKGIKAFAQNAALEYDATNNPVRDVFSFQIDAVAPVFHFGSATYSVNEASGPVTLTVTRDGDTTFPGSVTISTTDGTALAGTDYTALSNQVVNFAAGESTKTIDVIIANRLGAATSRSFTATLSSTYGLTDPVTTTVTITPTTLPGAVTFGAASYTVNQGATSIGLVINRTGGNNAFAVTINTADGSVSTGNPPFSAAVAPTDYTALSGASTTVSFLQGETTKTVTVTLKARTGAQPNRRFTATISAPTNGGTLGAITTTAAQILATDTTGPTVGVTTPAANARFITTATTVNLSGTAVDAHGVASVQYTLNSNPAADATINTTTVAANGVTTLAYSAVLTPVEGTNTVVVTAKDTKGNTTTSATRTFTYHLSSTLTLNRTVPAAQSATPDDAGNIVPIGAIFPATANLNPKTANVQLSTTVTLVPTTKVGFIFKGFTTTPAVTLTPGIGGRVSFTMVPNLSVTAEWLKSPYISGAGSYIGLIKAHTGTTPSNATDGLTRLTLTSAGTFSGSLVIDGATNVFTGAFDAVGAGGFGTSIPKASTLTIIRTGKSSIVLALAFNAAHGNNEITGTVTVDANVSDLVADKALYSAATPPPSDFLNVSTPTTHGYYTVSYPSKAQSPSKVATTYPQGDGYAVLTLTNTGAVSVTSTLADGTVAVASSFLVEGNLAPIFTQLLTPGSTTVKGGSFGGVLTFENTSASDVRGTDLTWYRATAAITGTAATDLYTAGWPDGVKVDALGAQYNAATDVATALALPAADTTNGNAKLVFSDGKLTALGVTKSKFNIAPGTIANTSAVTKIPTTDLSYTLAVAQNTGLFTGVFTPNWLSPSTVKPIYRGVILQKGSKGGYGFFLSNAIGDADPESGGVTLSAQ